MSLAEVFHALASILKAKGLATSVGDEGGFAPNLSSDEETIETILAAIEKAGYLPGRDFMLAMDAASSEWKSPKGKGFYKLPKAGTEFTSSELIAHWKKLVEKYPIISIEDGLDEEDWEESSCFYYYDQCSRFREKSRYGKQKSAAPGTRKAADTAQKMLDMEKLTAAACRCKPGCRRQRTG